MPGFVGRGPPSGREQQLFNNTTQKHGDGVSGRLISTSQLHVLPRFHIWPINPVV